MVEAIGRAVGLDAAGRAHLEDLIGLTEALFVDWHDQARAAVESLRFEVGRDPGDRATADLVAELRGHSSGFAQWWEQHRVHQRTHGSKRLRHPPHRGPRQLDPGHGDTLTVVRVEPE